MSGGPIFPYSAYPETDGKVFPNLFVGATNDRVEEGMGIMASLDGDAIWQIRFQLPPVLPSGTPKLRLVALANTNSGDAKINPTWLNTIMESSPDAIGSYVAEGVSTLTWGAGDADCYKELKITLDADTPLAGSHIAMNLVFVTSGWTLAVVSTWQASLIWE